jgi:molybdopterin-guanine dinucleotide biosynthesis protein A
MRVVAAILVGGQATRMGGVAKPLLRVVGRTILDRQLAVLRPLVDEILLVASAGQAEFYGGKGGRVVLDRRTDAGPGMGPLAGLETALLATDAEAVLLVGGDMPALHPGALELILAARPSAEAVVPRVAGHCQPLHARYARRVLPRVSALLDRGKRALMALLDEIDVEYVEEERLRAADPSGLTLCNVNTPEDLARLEECLRLPADDL